jgi:hypothetical protein
MTERIPPRIPEHSSLQSRPPSEPQPVMGEVEATGPILTQQSQTGDGTSAATEFVTCPECGTTAMVNLRKRESADFCRNCDYPLFWTPSQVLLTRLDVSDDSLRRLPGTTGRAMTASVACPHCAEPNPVAAEICVRCGLSMRVRAEAPPPPPRQPVYIPPPEPVYVEPKKRVPWWVWVIIGVTFSALIVLAILWGNGTIG